MRSKRERGKNNKGHKSSLTRIIVIIIITTIISAVVVKCSLAIKDDKTINVTKESYKKERTRETKEQDDKDAVLVNDEHGEKVMCLLEHVKMPTFVPSIYIEHEGLSLSYNIETHCPNWVAWELTSEETTGPISRKDYDFAPDPMLDARYQVEKQEYANSGYDRGHMCPAGDMEWSSSAMNDCHYMTNICPQAQKLNQVYWERLESACRRWANMYGSIYIVCGPIYKSNNYRVIGVQHSIAVPDGFFKVVAMLNKGEEKGIGFYYANDEVRQTMEGAATTIDAIEEMTGYDFFSSLDEELEESIESTYNLNDWR